MLSLSKRGIFIINCHNVICDSLTVKLYIKKGSIFNFEKKMVYILVMVCQLRKKQQLVKQLQECYMPDQA